MDLVKNVIKKAHKKKRVKKKSEKVKGQVSKSHTFSGGHRSAHRRFQHASEVEEKRLRRSRIYKIPQTPPPLVVVVQGPKSVGKSTLITSLVRSYSKRNVTKVNGPITLVSSRSSRLTLVECGNSLVDMIDCCKIADVAIMMIDASYGYEMETFEFVNMMQTHGFPRVIAILTHLEGFKDNKTLRRTKKVLKKRFWTEIYDGAKMFYFNGLQYGRYKKNEVINLTRYLSSQKSISISWRVTHPYCVCLRHEVVEEDGDKCKGIFYGYIYGGKLSNKQAIHIPGAGDFFIEDIVNTQDPCLLQTDGRTLKDKNRNIYAPYCDVGNLVIDDDSMYIQLFNTKEHFTQLPNESNVTTSETVAMVRELQNIKPRDGIGNKIINITDTCAIDHEVYSHHQLEDEEKEKESEDDEYTETNEVEVLDPSDEISLRVYNDVPLDDGEFKDFSKLLSDKVNDQWNDETLKELRLKKFINLSDDVDEEENEVNAPINGETDGDDDNEKVKRIQEAEQKILYEQVVQFDSIGSVGQFVRIVVTNIPSVFFNDFNMSHPIIIGGLQQDELGSGFQQLKIKRHRWYPKILKTNDPLLFSIGWRRFQSLPIYCIEDRNKARIKMLKYTPEHLHCLANIYGPLSSPNFGVVAIRNWERVKNYRISISGTIISTDQNYKIVHKLKLIGEPYKIMKNAAFIKNMFNSELEVIKCIGSKIQTASGIRGQIKKAVDKHGAFRATFEDKILMSDLVMLKSYIPVETKKFYNPILDYTGFRRIKNISELKVYTNEKKDSKYERKELLRRPVRHFNEIKIPKAIIDKLPFSSKPKIIEQVKDDTIKLKPSQRDLTIANMMQRLHTIRKNRLTKRLELIKQHKVKQAITLEKLDEERKKKLRSIKKVKYHRQGIINTVKQKQLLLK